MQSRNIHKKLYYIYYVEYTYIKHITLHILHLVDKVLSKYFETSKRFTNMYKYVCPMYVCGKYFMEM